MLRGHSGDAGHGCVSAQRKAKRRTERNGDELRIDGSRQAQQYDSCQCDAGPTQIGAQAPRHVPHGLRNHGNGHQLQPVDQSITKGAAERWRQHGKGNQQHDGRQREPAPRSQAAKPPGAQQADRKADLAAGRPRQELAQANQISERRVVKPAPSLDKLAAEVPDVCHRTAKRRQPQLEEDREHAQRVGCLCGP